MAFTNFLCCMIVLVLFVFENTTGQTEKETCISDMRAVSNILGRYGRCRDRDCEAGPPGKRGPEGPTGEVGPRGPKGDRGSCNCDLSSVQILEEKIRQLEVFQQTIRENTEICYAGISTFQIPTSHIRASSTHPSCRLSNIFLKSKASWCAGANIPCKF
ncbi:uncharacterized protein LOC120329492 [Styela clava]